MSHLPEPATRWPHAIKAVAFDMDGLMVNTEELYTEVCQTVLQRRGREFTTRLKRGMMGLPGPQAIDLMIETERLTDRPEVLLSESLELFCDLLPTRLQPLAGLLDLLDRLDQHHVRRCVATSSSIALADRVLSGVRLRDRVDFVITAEHVANGKPHPDIYLSAADGLNVLPEELLVLEDSQHGCRAGVTAGACTVAVPGSHSRDHDFSGVHYIANTLADPAIYQLIFGR